MVKADKPMRIFEPKPKNINNPTNVLLAVFREYHVAAR